jgi:transposase
MSDIPSCADGARIEAANNTLRGLTPNELAKLLRVSPDRIRGWIRTGQLRALNVASTRSGRPRFIVLPDYLREFEQRQQVSVPAKPAPKRRRKPAEKDFYPD